MYAIFRAHGPPASDRHPGKPERASLHPYRIVVLARGAGEGGEDSGSAEAALSEALARKPLGYGAAVRALELHAALLHPHLLLAAARRT